MTQPEPDAIRDIVIVMTNKQAAALSVAATAGMMSPLMLKFDEDGKPTPETGDILVAVAEAMSAITVAMGIPESSSFNDTLDKVREVVKQQREEQA